MSLEENFHKTVLTGMSSQNSFVNASLSSNTVSAGTSSTSAVRSRPRRFVSFIDDEDEDSSTKTSNSSYQDSQHFASGLSTTLSADVGTARSRGATPSPLSSRGTSPLPMKHPSRVTQQSNRGRGRNESSPFAWNGSSKASSSRGATDFLDSSWSSLQNLASSVLGSDTGRNTTNNTARDIHEGNHRDQTYIFEVFLGLRRLHGVHQDRAHQKLELEPRRSVKHWFRRRNARRFCLQTPTRLSAALFATSVETLGITSTSRLIQSKMRMPLHTFTLSKQRTASRRSQLNMDANLQSSERRTASGPMIIFKAGRRCYCQSMHAA